ncbi:MAG: PQQ-binding-like beta-propeller repeat protein [Blastocatellia bacterium]
MQFNRILITLLFLCLLSLQFACKDEPPAMPGAATTSAPTGAALITLPSSAVVVAETNQVLAYNADGNKGWSFSLPDNDTVATRPVAALSSTTYIRGAQGLYAIAPDGKAIWQAKHTGANDTIKGLTPLGDSTVAITVGDTSLVGYNGQPKWTFKVPDGDKITAPPRTGCQQPRGVCAVPRKFTRLTCREFGVAAVVGESAKK